MHGWSFAAGLPKVRPVRARNDGWVTGAYPAAADRERIVDSRRRAERASSGGSTKKSLDAWADESGIPKTTLFYRVTVKGLSTAEPLALGPLDEEAAGTPRPTRLGGP